MIDAQTQTLATIGAIYESALSLSRWTRVLDGVAEVTGGNGAMLLVHDPEPVELRIAAMSSRYKAEHAEQYLRFLADSDELKWLRVMDEHPPQTIHLDTDVWPDRDQYDLMPSVQLLKYQNLYHRCGVRLCTHGGWRDSLAILYADHRDGIRSDESARLGAIVPHMGRAMEMQRPLLMLQRRFHHVLDVLDRLGIGVLILRSQGEVVLANREANRIVAAQDGLRLTSEKRLSLVSPNDSTLLNAALSRIDQLARLQADSRIEALVIQRPTGGESYVLDLMPLRENSGDLGNDFIGAWAFLIDPDHRAMISIDGLRKNYRLTVAEGMVCGLLADGLSLRDIADSRNVSLDTIKTQARTIYAKTQTKNRRELVRRALSIVPPILDDSGRRVN